MEWTAALGQVSVGMEVLIVMTSWARALADSRKLRGVTRHCNMTVRESQAGESQWPGCGCVLVFMEGGMSPCCGRLLRRQQLLER